MVLKEQEVLGNEFKIYGNIDTPTFMTKYSAEVIESVETKKMPSNTLTYEQVKSSMKKLGYILISEDYKNSHIKMIITDEFGYFYYAKYTSIQKGRSLRKFDISNPYTIQNIKLWCKINNKPFELISDTYNGNGKYGDKLKWKCLKEDCGEAFDQSWGSISQNQGCPYCSGRRAGLSNCLATRNPELAKEWHPTKNGDLTPYDVTCGSDQVVWWICPINSNHTWSAKVEHRCQHNHGCVYCTKQAPNPEYNLYIINPKLCEEWDYVKNKKHPNEYYPSSKHKVWWLCSECNNGWNAAIYSRTNNASGCPHCNKSKTETLIEVWLLNNEISFNSQYTISNCKRQRLLPFDFAIFEDDAKTKLKCLIEYDGEFHYKPILGINHLRYQQENDKIKTDYCFDNQIKLTRIPYWEKDNIEGILERELINANKKIKEKDAKLLSA